MVTIPTEIISGLSVSFRASFPEYPAPEWTYTLYLRSLSGKADIVGVPDADGVVFNADAAETAKWPAEKHNIVIRVSKGSDVYQVYSGRIDVLPDVAGLESLDARTDAEKSLEAIRAVLHSRASNDQLKLAFNGRSLEKTSIADLLKLESNFVKRVNAERRKKSGRSLIKTIKVRLP